MYTPEHARKDLLSFFMFKENTALYLGHTK